VLVENVPDMLNLAGRNLADEIADELTALGFRCRYTLLNAAHYGVPQLRERLFLLGMCDGLGVKPSFPAATHRFDLPRGYESSRRVALGSLGAGGLVPSPSYWIDTPGAVSP
jgi:DNA (cytosine-5)-methyltransferase 1